MSTESTALGLPHRGRSCDEFGVERKSRDRLSKERRSWNMGRIRGKNTGPERVVRSRLHRMGYRFRLHVKKLPGRPDIVLPKYGTVIFVHGCFWHRHRGCRNCTTPTNRRECWVRKLEGNAARDKAHRRALGRLGWRVAVVWECETEKDRGLARMERRLLRCLGGGQAAAGRPKAVASSRRRSVSAGR